MQDPLLSSARASGEFHGESARGGRGIQNGSTHFAGRIVSQLEKDLVALESLASNMNRFSSEYGLSSGTAARATHRQDPESLARTPQRGNVVSMSPATPCDPQGDGQVSPIRLGHCSGYNFVFTIPLPAVTTDKDSQYFEKKFLRRSGESFTDAVKHCIISPAARKATIIDECSNLAEARNSVADLLLSFCQTLGSSLQCGIEVFKFTSEDCDELILCIKMSDKLSDKLAQMGDYPVQLSRECLETLHIKLTERDGLVPAFVTYEPHLAEDGLVAMYEKPHKPGEFTMLRTIDSMRLLYDKLTDYIDLHELERLGLISGMYLAHDRDQVMFFQDTWASFRNILWPAQPIDEIRDYFGEGVAFYFLFLGFLAKGLFWLCPVALVSSLGWWYGYPNESQCLFCLFIILWSTGLLKVWRRTESHYANKWGTDRHDAATRVKDPVNPSFHGEKKPSQIDENIMTLQADTTKAFFYKTISFVATCILLCFVIVGVGINQYLAAKQSAKGNTMAGTIGAVCLSVQIQFWDKLWDKIIVDYLNELEQHVTQYEYDQARVAKTFTFKFINTFYAFFYIAYVQQALDPGGCAGDCKFYLVEQLGIVFITYITFGLVDMGYPYVALKLQLYLEERSARQHGRTVFQVSMLEQQSKMNDYTGQDVNVDYLQSLFPVAFVMLFGTMMPSGVFLAYLALNSQIRSHAWKLAKVSKRPFPVRANGIGIWDNIITLLTYAAVFNTIGLIATQVDDVCKFIPFFSVLTDALGIGRESKAAKLLAFFFLQNTAIIGKLVSDFLVSDVTSRTSRERLRQEVQRVRVSERGHLEVHEELQFRCTRDSGFDEVPPLMPGNPMYSEPLV